MKNNPKMNIILVISILLSTFISSMVIEALSYTTVTYNDVSSTLNTFYSSLYDTSVYLVNQAPFSCSLNNTINCNSGLAKIGNITKSEYDIIGKNSYLFYSSQPFWVMQDSGDTAFEATTTGLVERVKTNYSGTRGAVFIEESTILSGSGVKKDPYILQEYVAPVPEQDINILAIYIDTNGDGNYTGSELTPVTNIPSSDSSGKSLSYILNSSLSNCANGETIAYNSVNKSVTISPINGQTSCQIYLKNVTSYLVNAIDQAYIREGTNNSITNLFVGKYVTMDPAYNNGNIPDPYNNSAVANPGSACSLTASGVYDEEGTGNCDAKSTYCKQSSYYSSFQNWRIIYVENLYDEANDPSYTNKNLDAKVYITTARSPECIYCAGVLSVKISKLNNTALKYCNDKLVDGGSCNSTNAYALNGTDFERISKYTRGRLNMASNTYKTLSSCKDSSLSECFASSSAKDNFNSLINNGEYYWFAENIINTSNLYFWGNMAVHDTGNTYSYGLRPVLVLKSGIKYTGGSGTHDDPYRIIP